LTRSFKSVELRPHTIDRYGRLVAVVYVNGTDAGLELLKQGLCWVYDKYVGGASAEIQTVIAMLKIQHNLKKQVCGKTLTRGRPGEWRKENVQDYSRSSTNCRQTNTGNRSVFVCSSIFADRFQWHLKVTLRRRAHYLPIRFVNAITMEKRCIA
jgi:Staphylococcal nuclease homologue